MRDSTLHSENTDGSVEGGLRAATLRTLGGQARTVLLVRSLRGRIRTPEATAAGGGVQRTEDTVTQLYLQLGVGAGIGGTGEVAFRGTRKPQPPHA